VKISNDIAHACNTLAPADTARTPKDNPKMMNATPIINDAEINRRACGARK
jgi:hypothetical protein